jgi:3-hydroxybutyrate dehydrogenase
VFAIHFDASFFLAQHAIRHFLETDKKGKIIFMGSVHSKEASVLKAPYVSAKHALSGLNRALAKEYGPKGIATALVCPGFVYTPLVQKQIPEQAKSRGMTEEQIVNNVMLSSTVDQGACDVLLFFTLFFRRIYHGRRHR